MKLHRARRWKKRSDSGAKTQLPRTLLGHRRIVIGRLILRRVLGRTALVPAPRPVCTSAPPRLIRVRALGAVHAASEAGWRRSLIVHLIATARAHATLERRALGRTHATGATLRAAAKAAGAEVVAPTPTKRWRRGWGSIESGSATEGPLLPALEWTGTGKPAGAALTAHRAGAEAARTLLVSTRHRAGEPAGRALIVVGPLTATLRRTTPHRVWPAHATAPEPGWSLAVISAHGTVESTPRELALLHVVIGPLAIALRRATVPLHPATTGTALEARRALTIIASPRTVESARRRGWRGRLHVVTVHHLRRPVGGAIGGALWIARRIGRALGPRRAIGLATAPLVRV